MVRPGGPALGPSHALLTCGSTHAQAADAVHVSSQDAKKKQVMTRNAPVPTAVAVAHTDQHADAAPCGCGAPRPAHLLLGLGGYPWCSSCAHQPVALAVHAAVWFRRPAPDVRRPAEQLEDKKKDAVKHLAAAKAAAAKTADSTPLSRHQKLIKWAEAHGLPKKLAENPKDRTKVRPLPDASRALPATSRSAPREPGGASAPHRPLLRARERTVRRVAWQVKDIIARMKADLMVERIKKEFAHDDAKVKDVVHSADPSAADA